MNPSEPGQDLIRRYLLGQLPDQNQQSLEEGFMTGETSLEELEAAEDELVDEYLGGRLSGDERQRFEELFLSTPKRQQKLRFAKVFHRYAATHRNLTVIPEAIPSSAFSFQGWPVRVTALALLVLVASTVWFFIRSQQPAATYATITLSLSSSDRAAGPEATVLKLPDKGSSIRLTLLLPPSERAARHRVELINDSGEPIPLVRTVESLTEVTATIAASELSRGQYVVKLYALSEDGGERRIPGGYFFTVE